MTTSGATWVHDPADNAYTLIQGDIRCRVWHTRDSWNAILSHRGDATAAYSFNTAEEAQAWCERLVTERKAGRDG